MRLLQIGAKTPFSMEIIWHSVFMNAFLSVQILAAAFGFLSCAGVVAQPASSLPEGQPDKEGVSSAAVLSFIEHLEKDIDAVHSFMILRHGKRIAQGWWSPYDERTPHLMHSLSKSFTSTAIGLAIGEGQLSLDDPVISFFPDDTPTEPGWQLKAMRIRDLITMTTGHRKEPRLFNVESDWVKTFLHSEIEFKPGTHFQYNSAATYMLSAILQSVTGERLVDYLDKRLFQPLMIHKPDWDRSPEGINTGGWGLRITTEDIAKLGQLYLQNGMWQGERILSEAWVQEATSKQTSNGSHPDNDWDQGYGYQFWRCRNNCYRGDGAFGQFCIVIPEHDAVVAVTSGTNDMGGVMQVVWDVLLPSMASAPQEVDSAATRALALKLDALSLPVVQGEPRSSLSGKLAQRTFQVFENEAGVRSISFDLHGDDHRITVEMDHGRQSLRLGQGSHISSELSHHLPYTENMRRSIGASGAWIKPDEYQAKIYFTQSPASIIYTFRFENASMTWTSELRHSLLGPKNLAILRGE